MVEGLQGGMKGRVGGIEKREREREEGEVQTSTCMTKKREGLVVNNTKKKKTE